MQISVQTQSASAATSAVRRHSRRPAGRIIGLIAVVVLALLAFMTWRMSHVPRDLDFSTTRQSEQGVYEGSYVSRLDPIRINQIHAWTFHLETADGQPITGAQISVDGGMPQHGHGLPTQPQVTQALGNGDYLVEGMKFNMPGWWVVNFHITMEGQQDTTTFNLMLQ